MPGLNTRMPFLLDSRIPINLYGLPLESGGVDPTSKTSQGLMQQLLAAQGLGPMDSWPRKHSLRTWYIYVHIYVYLFVWGMRRCVCIRWGICGTPYIVYIEIPNAFFLHNVLHLFYHSKLYICHKFAYILSPYQVGTSSPTGSLRDLHQSHAACSRLTKVAIDPQERRLIDALLWPVWFTFYIGSILLM